MSDDVLEQALAKVVRRRLQGEAEDYTAAEVDALAAWLNATLPARGKETRAERRKRNCAAWHRGDRRLWGGDLRQRDPRRGWRNFNRG